MVTNNKLTIMPTPTNQQIRVMLHEALIRTSPPEGNLMGANEEDAPDIVGHVLMQSFG